MLRHRLMSFVFDKWYGAYAFGMVSGGAIELAKIHWNPMGVNFYRYYIEKKLPQQLAELEADLIANDRILAQKYAILQTEVAAATKK